MQSTTTITHRAPRVPPADFVVLVVGETADGKSTLLNGLMDNVGVDGADRPEMLDMGSSNARGTTIETQVFETNQMIGTCRLVLVDTPGFGTQKVTIEDNIASIMGQFDSGVRINCIVLTAPTTTVNPGLGAQIVHNLVHSGIAGDTENAWNNIVVVGTKADRAEISEVNRFRNAVVPVFFADAPSSCKRHFCFTRALQKDDNGNAVTLDVSELLDVLQQLDSDFFYEQHGLTNDVLAKIFKDIIGMSQEQVKESLKEVDTLREVIRRKDKEIKDLLPGKRLIATEKEHLEKLLKHEKLEDTTRTEYIERRQFFSRKVLKKEAMAEATEAGIAGQSDEQGKTPLVQTFKYKCPPKGSVLDIVWHLYEHRFKKKVEYPEMFKVERIEEERIGSDGRHEYLMKWKNYPASENSWTLEEDIEDKSLIDDFRKAGTRASRRSSSDSTVLAVSGTPHAAKKSRKRKTAPGARSSSCSTACSQSGEGLEGCKRNATAACGGKGVCCCTKDHPHIGLCNKTSRAPSKKTSSKRKKRSEVSPARLPPPVLLP